MAEDDFDEEDREVFNMPRIIHRRVNYHLHASIFRQSFRVDRDVIDQVENSIGRYLVDTNRNNALSPRQQILTATHFMGNGCQYHVNGQTHGISKSTVCRHLHRVCLLIASHLTPLFIRWPTVSYNLEQRFFQIAGFPHVKGVVDGTLIHIDAPKTDEPAYVGRDGKHSLNSVVVSGPQNEILFISAKSPGSLHDSRALRISNLWSVWEDGWRPDNDNNAIILGDSAYPLTSWLIPPTVRAAHNRIIELAQAIELYQKAHRKTRFIVERTIGILKEEFPCLNYMRIKNPSRISTVIYAAATLHNMQNRHRRGSYQYDAVLHRIAQGLPDDIPPNDGIVVNDDLIPVEAVTRQRALIDYFDQMREN